jgi:predicted GNAT family acetyltransferase
MIKQIDKSEIYTLKRIAQLNGLTFNNSTNIYFGYFDNNILVGFCGLMIKNKTAILKNGFVLNSHRGKGIYSKLNEFRFAYIKELGINSIEGNMTNKSLGYHLNKGAEIIKQYKCCTKIKYTL